MSYEKFVDEVHVRAGTISRQAAERTIAATLQVLGERMSPADAEAVRSQLPQPLATHLQGEVVPGDYDVDTFLARVRELVRREGAEEHSRAVCQLLAEMLDEQARAHLRMQPLSQLFIGPRPRRVA